MLLFALNLIVLVLALGLIQAEDEITARLFLDKSSDTNPVIEGENFVIVYHLTNQGNAPASKIEIGDRYDPNSFASVENVSEEGQVFFEVEELAAGAKVSFNTTVMPILFGVYESTRARIKYESGTVEMDGLEPDYRNGFSTSLGRIKIVSAAENLRNTSYYFKEWSLFAFLYSIPTLIPLYLWMSSKTASEKISLKKK